MTTEVIAKAIRPSKQQTGPRGPPRDREDLFREIKKQTSLFDLRIFESTVLTSETRNSDVRLSSELDRDYGLYTRDKKEHRRYFSNPFFLSISLNYFID